MFGWIFQILGTIAEPTHHWHSDCDAIDALRVLNPAAREYSLANQQEEKDFGKSTGTDHSGEDLKR